MEQTEDSLVVSVARLIPAAPGTIFALLADPGRHPDLDGSGTVLSVKASRLPLQVGSHFDMAMKRGFRYSTRNTVLALEPDRRISWSTRPLTFPLSLLIGGRIWTYELRPEAGGTRVVETWDLRPERNRRYVRSKAGDPTSDMEATLERLEQLTASTPGC